MMSILCSRKIKKRSTTSKKWLRIYKIKSLTEADRARPTSNYKRWPTSSRHYKPISKRPSIQLRSPSTGKRVVTRPRLKRNETALYRPLVFYYRDRACGRDSNFYCLENLLPVMDEYIDLLGRVKGVELNVFPKL